MLATEIKTGTTKITETSLILKAAQGEKKKMTEANFLLIISFISESKFVSEVRQNFESNVNDELVAQIRRELTASYVYQSYVSIRRKFVCIFVSGGSVVPYSTFKANGHLGSGHVSRSSGPAKTVLQGTLKGGR